MDELLDDRVDLIEVVGRLRDFRPGDFGPRFKGTIPSS
jgi:hypothetical protein